MFSLMYIFILYSLEHVQRDFLGEGRAPDERVLLPVEIVAFRIVQRGVQAPALLAEQRAADDQFGHRGDVAQLDEVGGQQEIPVVLRNLLADVVNPPQGPFEALVGADDADVVPHAAPHLVPVVRDDDLLVAVARVAVVPGADEGRRIGHLRQQFLRALGRASAVDHAF